MTRSPPVRRPQLLSSPDRGLRSSFLLHDRNTESSHLDALSAAQAEHERVREAAIRAFELHELAEEHQRILDEERREQARLRAEAEVAAEERRLQELRAETIPKPAPSPVRPSTSKPAKQPATQTSAKTQAPTNTQAPAAQAPTAQAPAKTQVPTSTQAPANTQAPATQAPVPKASPQEVKNPHEPAPNHVEVNPRPLFAAPQQNGLFANQGKPAASKPVAPAAQQPPETGGTTAPKPNAPSSQPAVAAPTQPPPGQTRAPAQAPASKPAVDRLVQIHQELKTLRTGLMAQSKAPGSPLKGKVGAFRREIRVAIGQLTGGKGANIQPTTKITAVLKEALDGRIPSPPVEVSRFVAEPRQPAEGARNNDATLPALFVYLINICAKGIISQFINECGANPKAADPIGVFTAHLFSHKDFQWRGQSLIDILLAKFRVVCPVLFGFRGSDRTEKGRLMIGWRKDGPAWITEQSHNDRMAGLGAGFAAVALRDFSKTSKANPYPPAHYWKAMARIVNSPADETSNTQCVVLRAMIDGHEQRFLNFYGNAAVAALRLALVDFPKKAPQNASAAGSLQALAEVLRTEAGLVLV